MKGFVEGTGESGLREMLTLLSAEEEAFVRFAADGHVVAITERAAKLLGTGPMESIFEAFSAQENTALQEALREPWEHTFPKRIDGRLYSVVIRGLGDEAVILLRPRQRQTLLHAILSVRTANSLGSILYQAKNLQHEVKKLQELLSEQGLEQESLPFDADKKFSGVQKEVMRIKRAVQHAEWLEESEIYGAKPVYRFGDAAGLCRETANAFSRASGKAVEVRVPQTLEAVFDPTWIQCALLNLLTNARRADHICISAALKNQTILLSVEDNGEDPDGKLQKRLSTLYNGWNSETADLDRHFLNQKGEIQPGTGLPIAQMVALAHEGLLTYEALSPKGSAFRICFPDTLLADDTGVKSPYFTDDFGIQEIELSVL